MKNTDYQVVGKLHDNLSRMLLNNNKLTKEELLLSTLMQMANGSYAIRVCQEVRVKLLEYVGIENGTYNNYISGFKRKGIIIISGDFIQFGKIKVNRFTDKIVLSNMVTTNGMEK